MIFCAEDSEAGILYEKALFNIFKGHEVCPRGMRTIEVRNHQLVLTDVRNCVIDSPHRDLNFRFMIAEWLWMLLGLRDVDTIAKYNKEIAKFSDDGQIFNGAYGPRIIKQAPWVINNLREDSDSRQGVVTIWSPTPYPSKDIPCTISLQFMIRKKKIHCTANMRSSDGWLGLPYDLFNFAMMTNFFAGILKVLPGSLTMNLASSHLYDRNWELAREVIGAEGMDTNQTIRMPDLTAVHPVNLLGVLRDPERLWETLDWPWRLFGKALSVRTKKEARDVLRNFGKEEVIS